MEFKISNLEKFYVENNIKIENFDLNNEVDKILCNFFRMGTKGFNYIKTGVLLLITNSNWMNKSKKDFYVEISEINNTKDSTVYRVTRDCIYKMFWEMKIKNIKYNLGKYEIPCWNIKPTTFEFMLLIREQIILKNIEIFKEIANNH